VQPPTSSDRRPSTQPQLAPHSSARGRGRQLTDPPPPRPAPSRHCTRPSPLLCKPPARGARHRAPPKAAAASLLRLPLLLVAGGRRLWVFLGRASAARARVLTDALAAAAVAGCGARGQWRRVAVGVSGAGSWWQGGPGCRGQCIAEASALPLRPGAVIARAWQQPPRAGKGPARMPRMPARQRAARAAHPRRAACPRPRRCGGDPRRAPRSLRERAAGKGGREPGGQIRREASARAGAGCTCHPLLGAHEGCSRYWRGLGLKRRGPRHREAPPLPQRPRCCRPSC
jgi:hypothetical protein